MLGIDPLKVVGTVGGTLFKLGKKVGDKGFRTFANATDKITDGSLDNFKKKTMNSAKKVADKTLSGTATGIAHLGKEAEFVGNSALYMKDVLMGNAPYTTAVFGTKSNITKAAKHMALFKSDDESLLGAKVTKLGTGVFVAGSLVLGTGKAVGDFSKSRVGKNDGNIYNHTPMINGQTFSSMGSSYADNGGATGDLGFALHNQRHIGLY